MILMIGFRKAGKSRAHTRKRRQRRLERRRWKKKRQKMRNQFDRQRSRDRRPNPLIGIVPRCWDRLIAWWRKLG